MPESISPPLPRGAGPSPETHASGLRTSLPCSAPSFPCSDRFLSLFRASLSLLFWNRENAIYPFVPEQKNLQQNTQKRPKKYIFPVIFPVIAN